MSDAAVKQEADNVDDDLRNAITELKVGSEEPEARIVIDKPEKIVARDEAGKFAAQSDGEKSQPKARETLKLPAEKGGVDQGAQQTVIPIAGAVKAPEGWKGELKTKFSELPEWAQAEINRRESEAHKAITRQDDERILGKKINEMAMPYLPTIRAEGATVEKAFADYLQTAHVLRSGTPAQKQMALRAVAQQFNVDLGMPLQQRSANPQFDALQQKIAQLEGQLQGFSQQHQLQEQASLNSQIEDFAAKPGHEHFEKVRTLMGTLLESGQAEGLDDAYEKATYADPEIRSSLIAAQLQADQGKRLTELNAKTGAAKRAAVSITGAPGAAKPNGAGGSLGSIEDDVRAAMHQSLGRV